MKDQAKKIPVIKFPKAKHFDSIVRTSYGSQFTQDGEYNELIKYLKEWPTLSVGFNDHNRFIVPLHPLMTAAEFLQLSQYVKTAKHWKDQAGFKSTYLGKTFFKNGRFVSRRELVIGGHGNVILDQAMKTSQYVHSTNHGRKLPPGPNEICDDPDFKRLELSTDQKMALINIYARWFKTKEFSQCAKAISQEALRNADHLFRVIAARSPDDSCKVGVQPKGFHYK